MDLNADNFIRSRAADNRHAVRDAARPVLGGERFQAKALSPYRIAEDGDRVVIIAPGGELKFRPEARAALERALSGEVFTPADLASAVAPEDMTAKLLAYGLVSRV